MSEHVIEQVKDWLQNETEALLIAAGAGMGVDSGLPDFRGTSGFWQAYPPYASLGMRFEEVANPQNFREDPAFGWGFYGHRFNLYRETVPHAGFGLLKEFGNSLPGGCFVFTSNVDGHFETAGFSANQVVECHGSINHYQCVDDCQGEIYATDEWPDFKIDEATMNAEGPLPSCPQCGEVARPAILMFGDWKWNGNRTNEQEQRYLRWLDSVKDKQLAIIEIGAGTAVPSVRNECQRVAMSGGGDQFLVRINPREPSLPAGIRGAGIAQGGLHALRSLF